MEGEGISELPSASCRYSHANLPDMEMDQNYWVYFVMRERFSVEGG